MSPTKLLFVAIAALTLMMPLVPAQNHRRNVYSNPELPAKEALRRLNLHQAWSGYVPMDGRKDALLHVSFDAHDMVVLTKSGLVTLIEADTGHVHWRARVGKPYTLLPYVALNRRSVYVISNATMFALDRETGAERWQYPLPGGISAPPAVDKTRLFLPTATTVLYAYNLPFLSDAGGFREALDYTNSDAQELSAPRPMWSNRTNLMLSFRPLLSRREVMVVSPEGRGLGLLKTPRAYSDSFELFAFDLGHKVTVPPTSFADTAYIGCDDATLYAVNMRTGRLRWRHTAGTAITRSPIILDTDVFFSSQREGLARLDRLSGEAMWKIPHGRLVLEGNPLADRFLAANHRFVYATDHSGRLLVLDRKRGTKLSMLDTSAYCFPIVNDVTDRLYLAANNGLIVCLHDRSLREPLLIRKALEDAEVQKLLDSKISEPPGRGDVTLQEALFNLEESYELDFLIDKQAWADARLDTPERRLVRQPSWENRSLREYVEMLLNEVNAAYRVDQEIIRVIPKPAKKKGAEDNVGSDDQP